MSTNLETIQKRNSKKEKHTINIKYVLNVKDNKNGRKEQRKHEINAKSVLQVNLNGKNRRSNETHEEREGRK